MTYSLRFILSNITNCTGITKKSKDNSRIAQETMTLTKSQQTGQRMCYIHCVDVSQNRTYHDNPKRLISDIIGYQTKCLHRNMYFEVSRLIIHLLRLEISYISTPKSKTRLDGCVRALIYLPQPSNYKIFTKFETTPGISE